LCLKRDPSSAALAALAGVAVAAAIGFLNGAMATGPRILPFIVTLGMMGIARGLAKLLAEEQKINVPENALNDLLHVDSSPESPLWVLPWGVVVLAAFAVLTHVVLRYTVFGRYVFAIGSNESA